MGKRGIKRRKTKVIAIEGVHGVGKTTVYNILQKLYSPTRAAFLPERLADKPLFPFGSKDPQIAFRSELHFMQQMIKRQRMVEEYMKKGNLELIFLDRSAVSVLVYARALGITGKDYRVLYDYFQSENWYERIIFYLYAQPDIILERVRKRGMLEIERREWNEDDYGYIERLLQIYDDCFKKLKNRYQIIYINTNNLGEYAVARLIKKKLELMFPGEAPPKGQLLISHYLTKS